MIRCVDVETLPQVSHGLTTRAWGTIGPAARVDAQAARARAVSELGGVPGRLVTAHQVHGGRVRRVSAEDAASGALPGTDGLVTTETGTTLMVQGADCPLILLVDVDVPVLGVVHSGWRGTVTRIGARAVAEMVQCGARPERIVAAVFPGIDTCCFEVGPEVIDAFDTAFGSASTAWSSPSTRPGHSMLGLTAAIEATLRDTGVRRVHPVTGCTACSGRLWSHRASGGGPERHGLFALLR